MKALNCQACGGNMVKKNKSSGTAGGLALAIIVFVIGVALCLTIIGAIAGIPLCILALFMGGKKEKVWRCRSCGAVIPRM